MQLLAALKKPLALHRVVLFAAASCFLYQYGAYGYLTMVPLLHIPTLKCQ
jgi:hypothetical protein